jgi:hypothetical protein
LGLDERADPLQFAVQVLGVRRVEGVAARRRRGGLQPDEGKNVPGYVVGGHRARAEGDALPTQTGEPLRDQLGSDQDVERFGCEGGHLPHTRVIVGLDPAGDQRELDLAGGIDLLQGLQGIEVFGSERDLQVVTGPLLADFFRQEDTTGDRARCQVDSMDAGRRRPK